MKTRLVTLMPLLVVLAVMGMSISYTLKAADGAEMQHDIYNTINRVPAERVGWPAR